MKTGLDALFHPETVAVVGASGDRANLATLRLRHLREFGYPGRLYAIHDTASDIDGVPAVRAVEDIPGGVDYVYVALPAAQVEAFLARCRGHVRFAQVTSSGFSEVGNRDMEGRLVRAAREAGIRLVGPNCIGLYCPKGGLTFVDRAPREPGRIAFASQSGGFATDLIRRGKVRGLRFSKVVSFGNAADIALNDFLEDFAEDPGTEIVGSYIERVGDGARFLDALRRLLPAKPVVLIRGGSTAQGMRSAASHTGAMATVERRWEGICRQAGVLTAETFEEFMNVLVALHHANGRAGRRLLLVGPGGGASVLAADACDRRGFELVPLSAKARGALRDLGMGAGTGLVNPLDLPVRAMARKDGRVVADVLDAVLEHERFDIVLIHLNLPNFLIYMTDGEAVVARIVETLCTYARPGVQLALAFRSSGEPDIEAMKYEQRERATAAGIPVFDSVEEALGAYQKIVDFGTVWQERRRIAGLLPAEAS